MVDRDAGLLIDDIDYSQFAVDPDGQVVVAT